MKNIFHKNNFGLYLGIGIILLKLLLIDIDPPKWDVGFYQPVDELYYAASAYDLFEYGDLFFNEKTRLYGSSILSTSTAYFSLSIFGDSYLGLRFSSIFLSLISILLFWSILKKLTDNNLIRVCTMVLLATNYAFSLSNIIFEPTIARMASMLFVIFLLLKCLEKAPKDDSRILGLGMGVTLIWLITYPTNAFTALAVYLSLIVVLWLKEQITHDKLGLKSLFSITLKYGLGAILGVVLFSVMLYAIGENVLESILYKQGTFSGRVSFSPKQLVFNLIYISKANIFRFNPLLFGLVGILIISSLAQPLHKWKETSIVVMVFFFCFVLQTVFVNDYPQRKLIILLPLVLLLLANNIGNLLKNKFQFRLPTYKGATFKTLSVLGLAYLYWRSHGLKGLVENKLGLILVAIAVVYLGYLIFQKKTFSKNVVLFGFCLLLIPELFMSLNHFALNRTYHYKNTLQKLSKYDNANFIGGFSMGFRAYNDIRTAINPYHFYDDKTIFWHTIDSLSQNGVQDYSIGYKSDSEKFKKIGYEISEMLMSSDKTANQKDICLYREKIAK